MELITLREFQHLSMLSDGDMLGMLENGELKTSVGPMGELLIDITHFNPDDVAVRRLRPALESDSEEERLIEEMIATTIVSHFQGIINDALQLASQWYASDEKITD